MCVDARTVDPSRGISTLAVLQAIRHRDRASNLLLVPAVAFERSKPGVRFRRPTVFKQTPNTDRLAHAAAIRVPSRPEVRLPRGSLISEELSMFTRRVVMNIKPGSAAEAGRIFE